MMSRATSKVEDSSPTSNDGAAAQKILSWWKIARTVVLAMLLVVPLLVYLEFKKQPNSGRARNGALAQSGTRRSAHAAFDLSRTVVPRNQILSGGPPKDGIPALSQPQFVAGKNATYLAPQDHIIGVTQGGAARAYPLSAFSRENRRVEDHIAGKRVVVEFLPDAKSLRVAEAEEGVEWMYSLWFAWYAMHPETEVFMPSETLPR